MRLKDSFEPYARLNRYAGMRVDNFLLTAGVGSVTDTVYHPLYAGINGLARYFFINLTYDWARSGVSVLQMFLNPTASNQAQASQPG